jgi:TonB family protein
METLAKTTILLIVSYLIYLLVVKKHGNYKQQRLYLLFAPLASILFPFLFEVLTKQEILSTIQIAEISINSESFSSNYPIAHTAQSYITGLYFAVLALIICLYVFNLIRLISRMLLSAQKQEKYFIVSNSNIHSAYSFFNTIFLPESLTSKEKDTIIQHEIAHLQHKHSIDVIILSSIAAIQWFNPFAWLILKAAKEVHEYQADNATIESGIEVAEYCQQMLGQTFKIQPHILVNNFNKSLTLKRLAMLTTPKNLKNKRKTVATALTLLFTIALVTTFVRCNKGNATNENQSSSVPNAEMITPEVNASFQGGDINSFRNFIQQQLKYPQEAIAQKQEGKVILEFVVNKNGNVQNIKLLRSSGFPLLDKAAQEALTKSPTWTPAKNKGENSDQIFVIPVGFKL